MDTRRMRHVTALIHHRNYSRAADALGLTQSALTRSIQSLESDLGLRLFDRSRAGVVPTAAGRRFAEEAGEVLGRVRSLQRNMALLASNQVGDVAFGMGPLPASIVLPGLLSRVATEHSAVRVRTAVGSVTDLLGALKTDQLEFVIASRGLVEEGVPHAVVASIGWVELAPLVRRGHPLAGRRIHDKDLAGYPVLGGSPLDPLGSTRHPSYRPTMVCDDYGALRQVTMKSDAIWIAATCLAGRELVALRGASIARPNELVAVALAGRTLSPIALTLIETCRELLTEASKPQRHGRSRSASAR